MTAGTWYLGDHHGLAWNGGMALIEGAVDAAVAHAVWLDLRAGGSLESFLESLLQHCGTGLLALPGFAVAVLADGSASVAVRREFAVATLSESGDQQLAGGSVSTWAELTVPRVTAVTLASSDASPERGQGRPIADGVVPSDQLVLAAAAPSGPESTRPRPPLSRGCVQEQARGVAATGDQPDPIPHDPFDDGTSDPRPEADTPEVLPVADEAAALADERFGHLWAETMTRTSSYAAVWQPADDDGGGELPASTAHGSDESLARESDHDESSATSIAEETDLGATRYDEAVDQGGQAAPVAELDEDMVLITSIPQHVGRSTVATALLSGDWPSALRGTERRPPAPPERQPWLGPAADLGDGGDHDGLTIARLPDDPESTPGVEVRGLWCPQGHANPGHRPSCFRCGAPLRGDSVVMQRPALGRVTASSGEVIDLVRPVIAGRNPRAARVQGSVLPRLLPLPHPHVSSSHLEVTLEDWKVLARDLRSTNGTLLRRRDEAPVRLPETAQLLVSGDVLDLGHGVQLLFEDLP